MSELQATLRGQGKRFTTQRAAVYEALCAATDHPTAEELYFAIRGRITGISLATVYNTLEMLVTAGLAVKIMGEGAARYDAVCAPHGHARCSGCGTLINLPAQAADEVLSTLVLPPGFTPRALMVEVDGLCAACADGTDT
jgi:Fur family peroxide stress response transcriptional regulator